MATRIRGRLQTAVTFARAMLAAITARHVADLAIVSRVATLHDAMLALADIGVAPDPAQANAAAIAARDFIAQLAGTDLGGDRSVLDRVSRSVDRGIVERQLLLVDRLHLVHAIVLGVEQGLRDLLRSPLPGAEPVSAEPSPKTIQAPAERSMGASKRLRANPASGNTGTKPIDADCAEL